MGWGSTSLMRIRRVLQIEAPQPASLPNHLFLICLRTLSSRSSKILHYLRVAYHLVHVVLDLHDLSSIGRGVAVPRFPDLDGLVRAVHPPLVLVLDIRQHRD